MLLFVEVSRTRNPYDFVYTGRNDVDKFSESHRDLYSLSFSNKLQNYIVIHYGREML